MLDLCDVYPDALRPYSAERTQLEAQCVLSRERKCLQSYASCLWSRPALESGAPPDHFWHLRGQLFCLLWAVPYHAAGLPAERRCRPAAWQCADGSGNLVRPIPSLLKASRGHRRKGSQRLLSPVG